MSTRTDMDVVPNRELNFGLIRSEDCLNLITVNHIHVNHVK
jgi:hypothetical protein